MRDHKSLLHRVVALGVAILIGYGLIAVSVLTASTAATTYFLLGLAVLLLGGFIALQELVFVFLDPGGWLSGIESLFFLAFFWAVGILLLVALLPFAFLWLLIRYRMALRRFRQEKPEPTSG